MTPDVVLGLLDALAAEKAARRHALDQQRAAFAKTLGEAETAAYLRAREDALTAINNAGDYAHRMEAERDEAHAEIAAYQGRPEGAINEHWRRRAGVYRRTLDAAELQADEMGWTIYGKGGLLIADADVVLEPHTSRLPRVNMRAAEAKARELGVLS